MEAYPARDREAAVLVCNYLRFQGYSVLELPVYDGLFELMRVKARVLFFVNPTGGVATHKLLRASALSGARILTTIAEGNIQEAPSALRIEVFVWGDSTDKILHENQKLVWSKRMLNITLNQYPALRDRVGVSGGVGFDLPKILSKCATFDKYKFLASHGRKGYSRVIGLGCWDFGPYCYKEDNRYWYVRKLLDGDVIRRFASDRDQHEAILLQVVQQFPDILFLIKLHPCLEVKNELEASGVSKIKEYDNVLFIKNEEPVIDCIQACDFWLSYESTTSVQAWQLGKETGLINPSGTDFPRANVFRGSPNFSDAVNLEEAIRAFYSEGHLPGFGVLAPERERIKQEIFEYDDGLNHVRVGNAIIEMLNEKKSDNFSLKLKYKAIGILLHFIWLLSAFAARYRLPFPFNTFILNHRGTWLDENIEKHRKLRYEQQTRYYELMDCSREELLKYKPFFEEEAHK